MVTNGSKESTRMQNEQIPISDYDLVVRGNVVLSDRIVTDSCTISGEKIVTRGPFQMRGIHSNLACNPTNYNDLVKK